MNSRRSYSKLLIELKNSNISFNMTLGQREILLLIGIRQTMIIAIVIVMVIVMVTAIVTMIVTVTIMVIVTIRVKVRGYKINQTC